MTEFKVGGLYEYARPRKWTDRCGVYRNQTVSSLRICQLKQTDKFVVLGIGDSSQSIQVLKVLLVEKCEVGFLYCQKDGGKDFLQPSSDCFVECKNVEGSDDGNSV